MGILSQFEARTPPLMLIRSPLNKRRKDKSNLVILLVVVQQKQR